MGSGELIRATEVRCIPKKNSFKISDPPPLPKDFRVSELRTPSGSWDVVFIQQLFGDEVARIFLVFQLILWSMRIHLFCTILRMGNIL